MKPWCIPVFAVLILVFTFWQTTASFWIVWISAVLILIRSIFVLVGIGCCRCKTSNTKTKNK